MQQNQKKRKKTNETQIKSQNNKKLKQQNIKQFLFIKYNSSKIKNK